MTAPPPLPLRTTPRRTILTILVQLVCASVPAQAEPAAQGQGGTDPRPRRYRAIRVDGMATVKELQRTFGAAGFEAILHLNRIDRDHLRDGSLIVVPDPFTTFVDLSPFPVSLADQTPAAARLLIVARRVQAFAAYEKGMLVRWGAVSTGRRETPTPAGLFATNWRSKLRRSSDNPAWLLPWYFNFVNSSGVSFHQFELPGRPASHACVRLLEDDAKWIYDWAESWVLDERGTRIAVHGTPVVVFGDYDFGAPSPWTRLPDNPEAATITSEELRRALEPHRQVIDERAAARATWLAQKNVQRDTPPTSPA